MSLNKKIHRALISTYDKRGIVPLARVLLSFGVEIIATGGTARLLQSNDIPMTDVSAVTGFPEMMDGRVKTLHPAIHAGILARRGVDDQTLADHGLQEIDLVIINLYPFEEAISQNDHTLDSAIAQIDIGGPTLLRAAAKNFDSVTALCSPDSYAELIDELKKQDGHVSAEFRQRQAAQVFQLAAHYNKAIANYFSTLENKTAGQAKTLRYGENPTQTAQCIPDATAKPGSLGVCEPLQGKALSYNNLVDADAAWLAVNAFPASSPSCVIVKHATPCGIATASDLITAYENALATDAQSAFGGIIAFNQPLDEATAKHILSQQFVELICAPSFDEKALEAFSKKPSVRLLPLEILTEAPLESRSINGGMLQQSGLPVDPSEGHDSFTVVTKRQPTPSEMADLLFAWRAIKTVKSNAILYAKDNQTLGIGSGQTSRVFSAEIAVLKAKHAEKELKGAACASDAFFPFPDGLMVAVDAGITAVIQPGGSKNDPLVIEAADQAGITMVFTHTRAFKH